MELRATVRCGECSRYGTIDFPMYREIAFVCPHCKDTLMVAKFERSPAQGRMTDEDREVMREMRVKPWW